MVAGHVGIIVAVVVVAQVGESFSIAYICILRHTAKGFDKAKVEETDTIAVLGR